MYIFSGANVDARNYHGLTALHLAVCDGKTQCVRELINGGADVNATSRLEKLAVAVNYFNPFPPRGSPLTSKIVWPLDHIK